MPDAAAPAPTVSTEQYRCSFAADLRCDRIMGTAAPALGFLLVEQPGPWGRHALTQSRLDPDIGRALSARGVAAGLRVLTIRRPGRHDQPVGRRRFAVVNSQPGQESIRWGEFDADPDLLAVPLDGTAGEPSPEPTYLVCTHGRHDACCAIRGRPVAAALAQLRPEQTWECSHVGGDRFAPNVLALPQGLYYGRVHVDQVGNLVAAHERGEVLPSVLRGRTRWAPAAQAAQHHARELYDELSIEMFEPVGTLPLGGGRWQVRLRHGESHLVVTVAATVHDDPGLLTCHAVNPAHAPRFEILDVVEVDGSAATSPAPST